MGLVFHVLVTAAGLYAAGALLAGVHVPTTPIFVVAALVLGAVNTVVRPVLLVLSLPITLVTLGLFYFVVNGLAFGLAAALVPGFRVDSLWDAILGAFVVSVVSWLAGILVRPLKRG